MKLLIACLMAVAGSATASEAVYRYRGADRDARLLENARKEGSVVLYTSLAPTESGPLGQAFEKKTGVKVEIFRTIKDPVAQMAVLTVGVMFTLVTYLVDLLHSYLDPRSEVARSS